LSLRQQSDNFSTLLPGYAVRLRSVESLDYCYCYNTTDTIMANNNGRLGGGAAGGNNQMNEHVEFTVKVRITTNISRNDLSTFRIVRWMVEFMASQCFKKI
jgi:hypothetical protein